MFIQCSYRAAPRRIKGQQQKQKLRISSYVHCVTFEMLVSVHLLYVHNLERVFNMFQVECTSYLILYISSPIYIYIDDISYVMLSYFILS